MTKLTWDRPGMGRAGIVWVASVFAVTDAVQSDKGFKWELHGLRTRYLSFKTEGTLKTLKGAQAAAQRA